MDSNMNKKPRKRRTQTLAEKGTGEKLYVWQSMLGKVFTYAPSPNVWATVTERDGKWIMTVNLNGKTLTLSGTAQFGYGPQFSYNNPAGGIVDGSGSLLTSGSVRILGAGLYYKAYNYQELGLGGGVTWKNTGTVSDAGLIGAAAVWHHRFPDHPTSQWPGPRNK